MGLKSWFMALKNGDKRHLSKGHDFTDEEKEKALIVRAQNRLKKTELQALREELEHLEYLQEKRLMQDRIERTRREVYEDDDEEDEDDDEEDSPESLLMQLISQKMKINNLQTHGINNDSTSATILQTQPTTKNLVLTKEQAREWKKMIPSFKLSEIKKMSDDEIKKTIKLYAPDLNEESQKIAIEVLRE